VTSASNSKSPNFSHTHPYPYRSEIKAKAERCACGREIITSLSDAISTSGLLSLERALDGKPLTFTQPAANTG
jgi:hypothetical protein